MRVNYFLDKPPLGDADQEGAPSIDYVDLSITVNDVVGVQNVNFLEDEFEINNLVHADLNWQTREKAELNIFDDWVER